MESTEEEELDPRIQRELEALNTASSQINQYENQLENARRTYHQLNIDVTAKLQIARNKVGEKSLKIAVPYFINVQLRKQAMHDTQEAAVRYDRACSLFNLAKEMVHNTECKAEQSGGPLDPVLQEMLNHAIIKLNDAQNEKTNSHIAHLAASAEFQRLDALVKQMEKDQKSEIRKAKPFVEIHRRFRELLKEEEDRVGAYEEKVTICKKLYQETLDALEEISMEIHRSREEAQIRFDMGERGQGVGEEEEKDEKTANIMSTTEATTTTTITTTDLPIVVESRDRSMHLPRRKKPHHLTTNAMPIIEQLQKALQDQVREVGDLNMTSRAPSVNLDTRSLSFSSRSSDNESLVASIDFALEEFSINDGTTSSS